LSKTESLTTDGANMKYRDAKKLHNGDEVIRKKDKLVLTISSVEIFGQYKKVKFMCLLPHSKGGDLYCAGSTYTSLYNDEVE
jgi:hypothetical protein